mgnify:CR=1 FL=1
MRRLENSYFSLAFNDLQYLAMYREDDENSYNRVTIEAQQVVEKILKGIVEECEGIAYDDKVKLLGTHNLRKLGETVNKYCNVNISITNLAFLKDFYFDARYPGDNFILATKEDRDLCLKITFDVINKVKHLCKEVPDSLQELQNKLCPSDLQQIKSF